MQKRAALACIASSIVMTASVAAQQTPLQRCATIEDSLERLVCYDQLAQKQAVLLNQRMNPKVFSLPTNIKKVDQKSNYQCIIIMFCKIKIYDEAIVILATTSMTQEHIKKNNV